MIIWTILPFILFIIYDINSIKWKLKIFNHLFMFGFAFIAIDTIVVIRNHWAKNAANYFFLVPAVFCLIMLIYALFFALPFSGTYVKHEKAPTLRKTGLYAMCRHPGVLWFAGFYFFLSFMYPSFQLALFSATLSICNILYVVFQDFWSFPQTFTGYKSYKKEVPFLFPNVKSFRNGLKTMKNRGPGIHES